MRSEIEKMKWNTRIILVCPNTNQDVTVSGMILFTLTRLRASCVVHME